MCGASCGWRKWECSETKKNVIRFIKSKSEKWKLRKSCKSVFTGHVHHNLFSDECFSTSCLVFTCRHRDWDGICLDHGSVPPPITHFRCEKSSKEVSERAGSRSWSWWIPTAEIRGGDRIRAADQRRSGAGCQPGKAIRTLLR